MRQTLYRLFIELREETIPLEQLAAFGVVQNVPGSAHPQIAELEREAERVHYVASLRIRARRLLTDRSFISAGLMQKGQRITEAFTLDKRVFRCGYFKWTIEGKSSLMKGPSIHPEPLHMLLVHWRTLQEEQKIPRFGDAKLNLCTAQAAAAKSKREGKVAVPVFFSHPWLRPHEFQPDSAKNIKARKLVQFAKWYSRFCFEKTGIEIDVWYWIDYACVDQDWPHPGIAVLPAFIAACEIVLTWQTPDFDRRCWTMVERMLSYSFCPAGMTPYCINETFCYDDKPEATLDELEEEQSAQMVTRQSSITTIALSHRKWMVNWDTKWTAFSKEEGEHLLMHWKAGYRTCDIMTRGDHYVANFDTLIIDTKGGTNPRPIRYGREAQTTQTPRGSEGEVAAKEPIWLAEPRRRPRKLIYPLDLDACTLSNYSDVQHVRLLTDLALRVPAYEVFADRQSVDWGLTEVVEQSLTVRSDVKYRVPTKGWAGIFKKDGDRDPMWLTKGGSASSAPLMEVISVKEAAQRAVLGAGLSDSTGRLLVVHAVAPGEEGLREKINRLTARVPDDGEPGIVSKMIGGFWEGLGGIAKASLEPERPPKVDRASAMWPARDEMDADFSAADFGPARASALWPARDEMDEDFAADVVTLKDKASHHPIDDMDVGDIMDAPTLTLSGAGPILARGASASAGAALAGAASAGAASAGAASAGTASAATASAATASPGAAASSEAKVAEKCRWQVEVSAGQWKDYSEDINSLLEFALAENLPGYSVKIGNWMYDIDFIGLTQTNTKTRKARPVRYAPVSAPAADAGFSVPVDTLPTVRPPSSAGVDLMTTGASVHLSGPAGPLLVDDAPPVTRSMGGFLRPPGGDTGDGAALDMGYSPSMDSPRTDRLEEGSEKGRWQVQIDSGDWVDYSEEVNVQLEAARAEGRELISLTIGKWLYEVDLHHGMQTNLSTRKTRPIKYSSVRGVPGDAHASARGPPSAPSDVPAHWLGLPMGTMLSDAMETIAPVIRGVSSLLPPALSPRVDEGLTLEDTVVDIDISDSPRAPIVELPSLAGSPTKSPPKGRAELDVRQCDAMLQVVKDHVKSRQEKPSEEVKDAALYLARAAVRNLESALTAPLGKDGVDTCIQAAEWAAILENAVATAEKLRVEVQPAKDWAIETFCTLRLQVASQRVSRSRSGMLGAGGAADADSEQILRDALRTARQCGMEHLPAFRMVQMQQKTLYEKVIPHRVTEAVQKAKESYDPKLIQAAWIVAQDHDVHDDELQAMYEDVRHTEEERKKARQSLALPSYWNTVREGKEARGHDAVELTRLADAGVVGRIQQLMNFTMTGWMPDGTPNPGVQTRDRHLLGHKGFDERVPTRVVVEEVCQVENPENYLNYRCKKTKMQAELGHRGFPWPGIGIPQARTKSVDVHLDLPVDDSINEVYLWHGTNPAAAKSISTTDFDLKRVGTGRGTLFGRGLYFAESCLKADEYANPDPDTLLYPMLLARVVLGKPNLCRANRTAIDPNVLERSCTKSPPDYDSVIGDREFSVQTFREFIVFDNNQVYPEFIVWYRKEFD